MKPHIRCSQLGTVLFCPGSYVLGQRMTGRRTDSAASIAGQWCHAAAAQRLKDEEGFTGPEIQVPVGFEPTGFHRWISRYFVDTMLMYIDSDMAGMVEGFLSWEFDRFILTGHYDAFGITADGRRAVGGDLKAGNDPVVDSEDNPQMLGYRVLAALNYPTLESIRWPVIQPQNNPDDGLERVTGVEEIEGRDKLMAMARYLEREVNWALDHPGFFNSDGWRQCRYCEAALVCPATRGDIEDMKLQLTDAELAAIPTEPDLMRLWFWEQARKKFAGDGGPFDRAHEAIKEKVEAMGGCELADGTKLLITERPGKRTIENNAEATAKLEDLPDPLFHRCYAYRPAEIERALAEHLQLPNESKKGPSGKSEYTARLGKLTTQATSKILKVVAP